MRGRWAGGREEGRKVGGGSGGGVPRASGADCGSETVWSRSRLGERSRIDAAAAAAWRDDTQHHIPLCVWRKIGEELKWRRSRG